MFIYIALLVTFVTFVSGQDNEPALQLFNYNPPRQTYSLTLKSSTPTLPEELLGSYYLCSNGGVWILYQDSANYIRNGFLLEQSGCQTRKGTYPVLSVWLLESSKYQQIPTINLFAERFWGHPEAAQAFTADQPSYAGVIKSVAVTGSNAATFYTEEGYNGQSICIQSKPGNNIPFMGHFEYLTGIPAGSVKSFRFGCFSVNRIFSDDGGNIPADQ